MIRRARQGNGRQRFSCSIGLAVAEKPVILQGQVARCTVTVVLQQVVVVFTSMGLSVMNRQVTGVNFGLVLFIASFWMIVMVKCFG